MTGKQPTTQELKDLANMDGYGKAGEVLRDKYDPHWGIVKDDLPTWEVVITTSATVPVSGVVYVDADDEEQAKNIAMKLYRSGDLDLEDLDFETSDADIEIYGARATEVYPYD